MHGSSIEFHPFEHKGQLFGLLFGRDKDDGFRIRWIRKQFADQIEFLRFVTDVSTLFNRFIGFGNSDIDFGRVMQNLFGQFPDFGR